jgi:hypothetical protein
MKNSVLIFILFLTLFAFFPAAANDKIIIIFKDGKQQEMDTGAVERIEFRSDGTPLATSGIVPDKYYHIVAKNSGKCLDVAGAGMGNSDNVQQWECHDGRNQLWKLTLKGGDYYLVTAGHSGKCLDVSGISKASGANVFQWDCHGGDNQLWQMIPQGGDFYLLVAKHSGKCLDVSSVSNANGANIQQWDCHYGDNQLWKLR